MTREEAKARLKPGDRVTVVRRIHPCREGWMGCMDSFVGRTFPVEEIYCEGGVKLNGWWFPPEALEPELFGNEED